MSSRSASPKQLSLFKPPSPSPTTKPTPPPSSSEHHPQPKARRLPEPRRVDWHRARAKNVKQPTLVAAPTADAYTPDVLHWVTAEARGDDGETPTCLVWEANDHLEAAGIEPDGFNGTFSALLEEIIEKYKRSGCRVCPGARSCKTWLAQLEANKLIPDLVNQRRIKRDGCSSVWRRTFSQIRNAFKFYNVPLRPLKGLSALDIRNALHDGEVILHNGLLLEPLGHYLVFVQIANPSTRNL